MVQVFQDGVEIFIGDTVYSVTGQTGTLQDAQITGSVVVGGTTYYDFDWNVEIVIDGWEE